MKFICDDEGVSEIVGTLLLLSITVGIFSMVYIHVLNYDFPEEKPTAQIESTIFGENLILEHKRGDGLSIDSMVIINLNGQRFDFCAGDLMHQKDKADRLWTIGENVIYCAGIDLTNQDIHAFIIDYDTKYVYDAAEIL